MPTQRKSAGDSISLGMPAKITKLVEAESDRGAILILAAYLDELLGDLIRSSCVSYEIASDLLDVRRPAGDFESRIAICLAFGLIHSTESRALNTVRKIRNSAAHFDKRGRGFDVLFDSDATIDLVGNLAKELNLVLDSRDAATVKSMFIVCTRLLAMRLMLRSAMTFPAKEPETVKEAANRARAKAKGTPRGAWFEAIEEVIHSGDEARIRELLEAQAAKLKALVRTQGSGDDA